MFVILFLTQMFVTFVTKNYMIFKIVTNNVYYFLHQEYIK